MPTAVQISSKGLSAEPLTPAQAGANACSNTAASKNWAIQRMELVCDFIEVEYSTGCIANQTPSASRSVALNP